ncbi:RnfABCDGE type electron transport complex subunit D [Acholeplasma laidlawii]|jgi:Na+-transporting NADH:ubiquinone oxidoreductase subunit B/electron transport complex protein RnfD|uniref:RnfABCDGE type electron transport complex subunit D n=1 Tax=Acholeplasma laidlawii TaxID=2148 RepID=UPI0021F7D1AB|nr:RnfABCDGE type electron transport complex subunit D [Acholeplasma laidlawii]
MNKSQQSRIFVASALFILLIAASFIFGATVFIVGALAILTSFVVEILSSKARKETFDWTSFWITPLVITLLTTPTIIDQVWMVSIATAFGVFFAKSIWGGQDKNVFNPAMVGLIFIALAFPIYVNNFLEPVSGLASPQTLATIFKNSPGQIMTTYSLWDVLLGNYAGAIGTTFKLGIIILGLLMMVVRISDWRIPLTFVGTYFVLSLINGFTKTGVNPFMYATYSILMGHLMFAVMFVSTDPQTAPLYNKGKFIYGIGLGFITWIIQNIWVFNPLAPNTEGIIYSVTFMNAVVGLIDVWTVPKVKDIPNLEEVAI